MLVLLASFVLAHSALAAGSDPDPELSEARQLLSGGRYEEAKALLERNLATRPDNPAAHLALGRAYFALGHYAEAKIEFETVLRFDNLPPDVLSQVEIYDQAARQSLEEGRRLTHFAYAETGLGVYRVNSTSGTDLFGGSDRRDNFLNVRAGGGASYALQGGAAIDGSLDYRFRSYDNADSRNDSDLRWNLAGSQAMGENNLAVGLRGWTSYRGNGNYRNDATIFTDYRIRYDPDNQFTLGADVRRRKYPGDLRDLSRTTAQVSVGWVRAYMEGKGSFSLAGHAGRNYATNRPDGDSDTFGATVALDFTVNNRLGSGAFAWWERDSFNADNIHFHPDAIEGAPLRRRDDLYEIGAWLAWEFAPTWTLRPELLWIRDQSNVVGFNYSSTEVWINVRKAF
jgi:tetratricopeptide (TPR) repeat protein